jgi:hypothetical protein
MEALGESHWITIYYGPAMEPEEEHKLCGYYCPTLLPGGIHHCKVFGTVLETLEKPSDGGTCIVIARRCQECLTATQEKW